jgi:hypothetical protein
LKLEPWLTADAMKRLHLHIVETRRKEYTSGDDFGEQSFRDIEQKIRNIHDSDIRKIIRAIAEFDEEQAPQAWSHFMALAAGRHLFPDANHRTALFAFNFPIFLEWGISYSLSPEDGKNLVAGSKEIRDPHKLRTSRYFTIAELSNPKHPYRAHFASFEPKLTKFDEDTMRDELKSIIAELEKFRKQGHPDADKTIANAKTVLDHLEKESSDGFRKKLGFPPREPRVKRKAV